MHLLIILLISCLTGCSIFSPIKAPPGNAYIINASPRPIVSTPSHRMTLWVAPMEADVPYAGTEMAYVIYPYQMAYFAKNRWAFPPVKMIQPILVQSLRHTHHFNAVMTAPSIGKYDFILNTRLIKLQQDFSRCSSRNFVILTIHAEIIDAKTKKIIANKQMTVSAMAPTATPFGGVIAANEATENILRQITLFCLKVI